MTARPTTTSAAPATASCASSLPSHQTSSASQKATHSISGRSARSPWLRAQAGPRPSSSRTTSASTGRDPSASSRKGAGSRTGTITATAALTRQTLRGEAVDSARALLEQAVVDREHLLGRLPDEEALHEVDADVADRLELGIALDAGRDDTAG